MSRQKDYVYKSLIRLILTRVRGRSSLIPRPDLPEKEGPGIHCLRMRLISLGKSWTNVQGKDVFMWLLTIFGKLVCYETTPLVTETIPFVMDCKLQRVDREPGKYSSRPGLVVVQYVTSSSTYVDWERHMPLLICLGLDNYTHVQTVDTRPSFLGQVGPRSEARKCKTSRNRERCFVPPPRTQQLCGQRPSRLYHSTL